MFARRCFPDDIVLQLISKGALLISVRQFLLRSPTSQVFFVLYGKFFLIFHQMPTVSLTHFLPNVIFLGPRQTV